MNPVTFDSNTAISSDMERQDSFLCPGVHPALSQATISPALQCDAMTWAEDELCRASIPLPSPQIHIADLPPKGSLIHLIFPYFRGPDVFTLLRTSPPFMASYCCTTTIRLSALSAVKQQNAHQPINNAHASTNTNINGSKTRP